MTSLQEMLDLLSSLDGQSPKEFNDLVNSSKNWQTAISNMKQPSPGEEILVVMDTGEEILVVMDTGEDILGVLDTGEEILGVLDTGE